MTNDMKRKLVFMDEQEIRFLKMAALYHGMYDSEFIRLLVQDYMSTDEGQHIYKVFTKHI